MSYHKRKSQKKPKALFSEKLILNQWILYQLGAETFDQLAYTLRKKTREGVNENNIHFFFYDLLDRLPYLSEHKKNLLLGYDQNIFKHTRQINDARMRQGKKPVVWKYFQYLALLFCEIYLDQYFDDPASLIKNLNERIRVYNLGRRNSDKIDSFSGHDQAWRQLNKLSYWMATGSGKTLLMHVNLLQYLSYLTRCDKRHELNHILLLTPNEGLSRQHLSEFHTSGISARLFDKRRSSGSLFRDQTVEILEVTKLRDQMGDKTIAVDAFEGNNLVFIDEGHRGASSGRGGTWMGYRNSLCENGFSFEYSATFGQAIKGNPELTNIYAKSTLYDYSYRYFYADGYGKDYQILNLDQSVQQDYLDLYLVASLLSFFQQKHLYHNQQDALRSFNIENPLWIFVGGRVTATLAKKDASDIVQILKFLTSYVSERSKSIQCIDRVLNKGLITFDGKNLFSERFNYLNALTLSPADIYDDTLAKIFNAPNGGALHIEDIKGASGEIALKVGADNDPFGVINVGDDAKLLKICKAESLMTGELNFSESLFHQLNEPHSKLNILIGAKKFTEGWNCWRVSTMGLMNVGRSEGAQIIQLFGRGVRLKGHNMSLKRSGYLPETVGRPNDIAILETLGIYGIHADYMAQFRDFLLEEGLPLNEDRIEFILPVITNLGTQKLKTIRLKNKINGVTTDSGMAFRKLGPIPTVAPPDSDTEYLKKNPVRLNWYPKILAMKSNISIGEDSYAVPNQTYLHPQHLAFLNYDHLYFEIERFRVERGWYNLNLSPLTIKNLLDDPSWYRLQIPSEEMICDSYDKVRLWEDIALTLLKQYVKRYYAFRKREWELPHLEYQTLTDDDPNFLGVSESSDEKGYYRILIDRSKDDIVKKLGELKDAISRGEVKRLEFRGIETIWYKYHLFRPLLGLRSDAVEITPAPLNESEYTFVRDLQSFHSYYPDFFKNREIYLLRNLSHGRGIGFFEAGNFYPDFILWVVSEEKQQVLFVDPKGVRHLSPDDPKIQFFKTIKEIEERLGDPNISLHSFIVSNTSSNEISPLWQMDKSEIENMNVLFQEDDYSAYIKKMLYSL